MAARGCCRRSPPNVCLVGAAAGYVRCVPQAPDSLCCFSFLVLAGVRSDTYQVSSHVRTRYHDKFCCGGDEENADSRSLLLVMIHKVQSTVGSINPGSHGRNPLLPEPPPPPPPLSGVLHFLTHTADCCVFGITMPTALCQC